MALADRFSFLYMLRACWRLSDARERRMLVGIYAVFIGANCFSLTEPLILAQMIRTITAGGPHVLHGLVFWSAVWLGVAGGMWCLHGSGRVLERTFGFALRSNLTRDLYGRVTHMPWAWHQNHHSGAVLNQVNFATQSVFEFADNQYLFIQLTMRILGSIGILLYIAPGAGLIMAIALPLLTLMFKRFDTAIAALSRQVAKGEGEVAASLTDYLGNIGTVLTLRLQQASQSEIMRRLAFMRTPVVRGALVNESKWCAFGLLLRLVQAVSLIGFVWFAAGQAPAVMAGTAVAIQQYLQQVGSSFMGAATVFQTLIRSRINMEQVAFDDGATSVEAGPAIAPDWKRIAVEGLGFSYEDREHNAHHLRDLSLHLQRGRRIALVGTSGSGKSTLLRLLRGLHEAEAGSLTVDGTGGYGIGALAELSTLVPQDPEIFENTILYNITCGVAEDPAQLTQAIHDAVFDGVVAALPSGLDTDIRERGVNLSGGQKQRLALARGLLAARQSSLILLDEPTSSLDAATESLVFDRLFASRPDACVVASLHRLHLLERFHQIYVMEAGRIVEQGSFAQLVAAGGVLARLWKAQQAERANEVGET